MKKLISVFLSLIIAFTAFCCADFSACSSEKLTNEEAVDLFYNNMSSWIIKNEPIRATYTFLDLDFDGTLELVSTYVEGSGRYSRNCFYKINSDKKVVKCNYSVSSEDEFDLFRDDIKVIKNNADNSYKYYCTDFIRAGASYYTILYGTLYMKNNKVMCNNVFAEDHYGSSVSYYCFSNDDITDVSKTNYNKKQEEYFKANTDANLKYSLIAGEDFLNASNEKRKEMLLNSYNDFSYDGINGIKLYASDPNMTVGVGDKLRVGVGIFEKGKRISNLNGLSLAVENNSIARASSLSVRDNVMYFDITGIKAGITYVQVSYSPTGEVHRVPITVSSEYGNVYTTVNMPKIKPQHDAPCNIYNFNGLYVDNFPENWGGGKLEFDVYNTAMINGIVEIHDETGKLTGAVLIEKLTNNNSNIWESVVDNSMCLVNDFKNGTFLSYKQESGYSKKTHVKINDMPEGGYLVITNDMSRSPVLEAVNTTDMLLMFRSAVSALGNYSTSVSKKVSKKLTEELTKGSALRCIYKVTGLNGEKIRENMNKEFGKALLFNKESYGDFLTTAVQFLSSIDIEPIIYEVLKDTGVSIGEKVFEEFAGIPGLVLQGMFVFSKNVNAVCQFNHYVRSVGRGAIQINTVTDNYIQSNGVSVKQETSFDEDVSLESYRIQISNYDRERIKEIFDNIDYFKKDELDKMITYEINVIKNGSETQPDGKVEVTIYLPEELKGLSPLIRVCHVKDDGTVEELTVIRRDMVSVTFVTDHFSKYTLVPLVPTTMSDISGADVYLENQAYTGKAVTPKPIVSDGETRLTESVDYELSYEDNIEEGGAAACIYGCGNYYGYIEKEFTIACNHSSTQIKTQKATLTNDGKVYQYCNICKKEIAVKKVIYKASNLSLSNSKYTYNGKVKKPSVKVKDSKNNAISSSNYTVSYAKGRKYVGKYAVTIKFKGDYSGSKTLYFTVVPKGTGIKKLSKKKNGFSVKWKKNTAQTSGYQIQYSTDSKFKNKQTITVSNNKATAKTISKLKSKKKYYVRIRTFKKAGNTKYYSDWSKYKTVTTK